VSEGDERRTGVIEGFYDSDDADDEPVIDQEDSPLDQLIKATPRSKNIGNAFLNVPTEMPSSSVRGTVYVVNEVRSAYGRTKRRVVGVFGSRQEADWKASEIRQILVSFLERQHGRPMADEMSGGTMLQYWHAGNPLAIMGFAVYVEEAECF